MNDDLTYELSQGIGRIGFNRPKWRNALTLEMYQGVATICREMPSDGSVKALIIAGAGGKAFAAGTDMAEFHDFSTPEDGVGYEADSEAVFDAVERCPVPTIAAITGACTGGGAAIAAACDLRLCDRKLKFGFPIARTLGNCLSIRNLSRLSALIGQGRVREMLLTARLIGADEAIRIGAVNEVLDDADAVFARAEELAATLAAHAPLTLRATREAMRRLRTDGTTADDSDLIGLCYSSADFREGREAFLAKRKPAWTGR